MHVTRLDLRQLRRFADVSVTPGAGLNLFTGDNGAGKTSVLEGLHLMAYGRSFRGRVRDGLIRSGLPALEVFVEWQETPGPPVRRRAGMRHTGSSWEGRVDGTAVSHLGELCAALAVVTFEPGSHALITGGSETRRRYLDWGLFHVEHEFLPLWRRYARALKQRNALLKARARDAELDAWDHELVQAGEPLSQYRQRYLEALEPRIAALINDLAPALGGCSLAYQPGWRANEVSLADALLMARDRDLLVGHTSVGPHRADWRIELSGIPGRDALSRGQAKLVALAALLGQAEHHAATRGDWPVVALDDLASELDRQHQRRVLQRLIATGAQVWITGTDLPPGLQGLEHTAELRMFHVEHGEITLAAAG